MPSPYFSHFFLFSTQKHWQQRLGWGRTRQKVGGNLGLGTGRAEVGGWDTHAGGGCSWSVCQGLHVCACTCQWQSPVFLPTYLQSQLRKIISEAEGPFATVTLTVKGRVPGALSTDGSHSSHPPPQPHEQMTSHHQRVSTTQKSR